MCRARAAPREVATWVSSSWQETLTVDSHLDGVHPDGSIDIVWDGSALVVFGPRTRSEAPRELRTGTFVGVRRVPGSPRAMLGEATIALADRTVPLEALWGGAARTATLRIQESGPEQAMTVLSSVITERGRTPTHEPDRLIPTARHAAG